MTTRRVAAILVAVLLLCGAIAAKDNKPKGPKKFAFVEFTILKDVNGKPVRNASVVLRAVDENGKQALSGPQLKTDSEGKAHMDGVPYGTVRVQVIAPGLQTFGEDYQVNEDKMEFTIRLKPPKPQVTIY